MLGAVQMLRAGTTATVDFLFEAPEITIETLEPVVRAYRDAGMRATILLGVADKPFLDSLPIEDGDRIAAEQEATPPSVEGIMSLARAAVERFHEPGGLIGIGVGPSAPQRCTDELMAATMDLARERNLVWQTHVLETRTQGVTSREWHGRSFVETLEERGLLGPPATLVHTVWLTERDMELMSRTDTPAVHCLMSNLRLGDGIAKLTALRRAGVHVALGTDGRGCDETLDMLELTRMTALIHKARGEHFDHWTTAREVLAMTTRNASRCAGHGERLGRIEEGAEGDLVIWDRNSITFTPLLDPLRQLVYGGRPDDVRDVIVSGRRVIGGGEFIDVDVDDVLRRSREHAEADLAGAGGDPGAVEEVVRRVFERAEQAPLDVDSYIGP
jgi:cytosine/adenosine deaminase-related metal-dependent hydrolase